MLLVNYTDLTENKKIVAINSWKGTLSFEFAKEILEQDPYLAYFNNETGEFVDETTFEEY